MNSHVTRRDLFRAGTQGALTAAVFAGVSGGPVRAGDRRRSLCLRRRPRARREDAAEHAPAPRVQAHPRARARGAGRRAFSPPSAIQSWRRRNPSSSSRPSKRRGRRSVIVSVGS